MGIASCVVGCRNYLTVKQNISTIYKSGKSSAWRYTIKELHTLRRTGWIDTILVIASGFTVLLISVILIGVGFDFPVYLALSIITPLVALLLGAIGLKIYADKAD